MAAVVTPLYGTLVGALDLDLRAREDHLTLERLMAGLQANTNAVVRGGRGAEAEIDTEVAAGHPDGRSAANAGSLPSGAKRTPADSGLDGVMK